LIRYLYRRPELILPLIVIASQVFILCGTKLGFLDVPYVWNDESNSLPGLSTCREVFYRLTKSLYLYYYYLGYAFVAMSTILVVISCIVRSSLTFSIVMATISLLPYYFLYTRDSSFVPRSLVRMSCNGIAEYLTFLAVQGLIFTVSAYVAGLHVKALWFHVQNISRGDDK